MSNRLIIWMPVETDSSWAWVVDDELFGTAISVQEKLALAAQSPRELVVIIPGQWAKIFAHELPKMRNKDRLSAAGFSIEDQTAAALKEQHIVLGAQSDDRIAVIASGKMQGLLTELSEANLNPDGIYIDFDVVSRALEPIRLADRIIVPGPNGHTLDADWDDGEFSSVTESEPRALSGLIGTDAAINLRQGQFARRSQFKFGGNGLARIAALIGIAALSWGLYQGSQARALNQQAAAYKAEASQLFTQSTGKPAPANVALTVTRAAKGRPASGADVLTLSSQLFAAIAQTDGIMIDVLQYDQDKQELVLRLIYPTFESAGELERAAAASGGEFQAGGVREQGGDLIGDAVFRLGGAS